MWRQGPFRFDSLTSKELTVAGREGVDALISAKQDRDGLPGGDNILLSKCQSCQSRAAHLQNRWCIDRPSRLSKRDNADTNISESKQFVSRIRGDREN